MADNDIKNLREALKHSPDNVPLLLHLAAILLVQSKLQEAEKEYKKVLRLEPQNTLAKLGLAKTYLQKKEGSTAIIILEELVRVTPQNRDARLMLSKAFLREGSVAEAQEQYEQLLKQDPDFRDDELDSRLRQRAATPLFDDDDDDDDFDFDGEEEIFREMEKPDITFSDVGGMEDVKREIELKIIRPVQHPELYEAYGKKTGGGILLYGPPGCGKTHLARATAGEVNAGFMSVGINDILDMWIGSSERNLHELFEGARANTPCVLFFDEVDALGASRSDMRQSSGRHLINQFLSELDGVDADNEGLLILAATNAPWHLDPAFRRPGRFDRIVFVPPPDVAGRIAIMKILLQKKPVDNIDYEAIARKTEEFSGADLRAAMDMAIEEKLQSSFKTGIAEPITTKDMLQAVKKMRPSTQEWFGSARNYALYANDSGLYDDILRYLKIKK